LSAQRTLQGVNLNLRKLDFSPDVNPLVKPVEVKTRRKLVKAGMPERMMNIETGEITGVATVHTIEETDDIQFVKVFAAGVAASFDLTKTAQRVFNVVLGQYQNTPLTGGFADSIYLSWFNDGIDGRAVGMSEKTFQRGLKELLQKGFLAPRSPEVFWVNPGLFFKGDRVRFIKEYVRRQSSANQAQREALEAHGQLRIEGT